MCCVCVCDHHTLAVAVGCAAVMLPRVQGIVCSHAAKALCDANQQGVMQAVLFVCVVVLGHPTPVGA